MECRSHKFFFHFTDRFEMFFFLLLDTTKLEMHYISMQYLNYCSNLWHHGCCSFVCLLIYYCISHCLSYNRPPQQQPTTQTNHRYISQTLNCTAKNLELLSVFSDEIWLPQTDTQIPFVTRIIWNYLNIFWILCRYNPLTWNNNFKTNVTFNQLKHSN